MNQPTFRPVPESYDEIQAIPLLRIARQAGCFSLASPESSLLAILQAAEIGMFNLADLYRRAAEDVAAGRIDLATVKVGWAWGYHRILNSLGGMRYELPPTAEGTALSLQESPALREFSCAWHQFDLRVLADEPVGKAAIRRAATEVSLDDPLYRLLHFSRLCAYQATVWQRDLDGIRLPGKAEDYGTAIRSERLREAVWFVQVEGDTFMTQFRGLHQVAELLAMQAGDLFEQAIKELRAERRAHAAECLQVGNALLGGVVVSLDPLVEQLSTVDYHALRKHLRVVTSGMHSVAIYYHLFGDLYTQLAEELRMSIGASTDQEASVRALAQHRLDSRDSWLQNLIVTECLKYRRLLLAWRDQHLHLPRNFLGGHGTKSLAGTPDAVESVDRMRHKSWVRDPLRAAAAGRGLPDLSAGELSSEASYGPLDDYLLAVVGEVARERFPEVQERAGPFAAECPFRPPPRRQV